MIHSFKELRLTNNSVKTSGARLMVNTESGAFLSDINNVSGYSNNTFATISNLELTGQTLFNLIGAASAGVSSLNGQSGILNLTGAGNVSVLVNGQAITISGNTGFLADYYSVTNPNQYSSSGNVAATGTALQNQITSITNGTGNFYLASNPQQYIKSGDVSATYATISNLGTTGSNLYNSLIVVSGNSNTVATNLATTGSNLISYIQNFSGNQQSFSTGINPTGFDNYYVGYPLGAFNAIPRIFPSIEISGNYMYSINITGRGTAGFYALFSDIIAESGVVLHVFATVNS